MNHSLRDQLTQIREQTDLREIAERILGEPRRRYTRYHQYQAPDRRDSNPSLAVYRDGFKDYGDNDAKGDVFKFLERYASMDFQAALEYLTNEPRRYPPTPRPAVAGNEPDFPPDGPPSDEWQSKLTPQLEKFQKNLWQTPKGQKALEYLRSEGYSDEMILSRRIGYNPAWSKVSINGQAIKIAPGIVYGWWRDGQLYGVKVRCPFQKDGQNDKLSKLLGVKPELTKYIQVAGGRLSLAWYGDDIGAGQPVIFTEGEKDCDNLATRLNGFSIVTGGSAGWSIPNKLLRKLKANKPPFIIIAGDSDKAGQDAAGRLIKQLQAAGLTCPILWASLPEGYKDPTEFIIAGGDMGEWLAHIIPNLENTPSEPSGNWELPPIEELFNGGALAGEYIFAQGVPDALRTCFLNIDQIDKPIRYKGVKAKRYFKNHTPALIIYELIYLRAAGEQIDPRHFTRDNLRACATQNGLDITEYTLGLGLHQLTELGFLRNLHPIEIQESLMGAKIENNPGGRPVDVFALLPIRQALNTFLSRIETAIRQAVYADILPDTPTNIETEREYIDLLSEVDRDIARWGHPEQMISKLYGRWVDDLNLRKLATAQSTPLAAGFNWGDKSGYLDAFNRGKLDVLGGERQTPNKILASELGCSENALRASNKRANILSMENYQYIEIEPGASRQKVESVLLGRGRAWWIADGFKYEKVVKPERLWSEIDHIADIVDKGGTVTVRIQTASIHTPSTPEQIEAVTAARREKLRAIRAYREMNTPQDATPVETPPTPAARVETLPSPVDTLSDGVTLQYILDQYALRIWVLDWADPRRDRLIHRYAALGGNILPFRNHPKSGQKQTDHPTPLCQMGSVDIASPQTANPLSDVPEWVKRMTSKKIWERRGA